MPFLISKKILIDFAQSKIILSSNEDDKEKNVIEDYDNDEKELD